MSSTPMQPVSPSQVLCALVSLRLSAEGWNERRTFGEIAEWKNREKLIMLGMKGDSASFESV